MNIPCCIENRDVTSSAEDDAYTGIALHSATLLANENEQLSVCLCHGDLNVRLCSPVRKTLVMNAPNLAAAPDLLFIAASI